MQFSIVTPTYNRPDRLERYLESLTRLDYSADRFEVVLVDDGSDVPTAPVADRYRDRLNIQFLQQSHGGVAKGRHLGAESAHGRFLAFTDDDCVPAPDWLKRLEAALVASPNTAVGGHTVNALTDNLYSEASQVMVSYLYAKFNGQPAQARFLAANNFAMPREGYFEIGGLDTSWPFCGEDRDLCERWRDRGYRLEYVADAVIFHHHHLDLGRFWKQHFNYGRGARRLRSTAAGPARPRVPLEALSFYLGIPLAAFRYSRLSRAIPVAALLVLSQVSNTWGYLQETFSPSSRPPTWKAETAP